jgi:hypothetical protein
MENFRIAVRNGGKSTAWHVVRAIALVGVINFILFVAGSFYLGGDALNGYRRDGHYFLGMHSNGPFTEVSRSIFLYSEWHGFLLIGNFAIVLVASQLFRQKK